jgi:DNA adenine methylase
VLLSGYACELYDTRLKHWRRETRRAQAEKGQAREEVLWLNPVAAKAQRQQTLFQEGAAP